jgi:hypothetical protein
MSPHPTGRLGLLRLPGPALTSVVLQLSPLSARDHFDPSSWPGHALGASATFPGWFEIDLDALGLADGDYEYQFLLNGTQTGVADPYADTLTVSADTAESSPWPAANAFTSRLPGMTNSGRASPCRKTTRS